MSCNEEVRFSNLHSAIMSSIKFRALSRSAITLLLCLWSHSTISAQSWTQLANPSLRNTSWSDFPYTYFVTAGYGFVVSPNGGRGILYRTVDSGNTWNATWTTLGVIFQLDFVSPSHGYCVRTNIGNGGGGIYETSDSGSSWNQITAGPNYSFIYAVDHKLFVVNDSAGHYQLLSTTNDGQSWNHIVLPSGVSDTHQFSCLTGNGENLIAFLTLGAIVFSTNEGLSWSMQWSSIFLAQYALASIPHSCYLLASNGNGGTYDSLSIYRSEPPFANWTVQIDSEEIASWFGVTDCTAYAYYAGEDVNNGRGLLQSTDQGNSWHFVKSPIAPECDDAHHTGGWSGWGGNSSIIPCGNSSGMLYLYADTDGSYFRFYRWTDTTPLQIRPFLALSLRAPQGNLDTLFVCDTGRLMLLAANQSCAYANFDSLSVTGLDSGIYYAEKRYHACGTNTDTVLVTIVPKVPGTHTLALTFHFEDDNYDPIDTTFQTTIVFGATPGTLELTKRSMDFGAQSLCAPILLSDSFAILHACERVTVDSIIFRPDSVSFRDFSFKPVRDFIPQGHSDTYFSISFKPSIADTERGSILIFWNDGEQQHVDTIRVQGAGVQDTRSFAVGSPTVMVQMCDSSVGTITLTNTTCGLLELDSLTLPAGLTLPLAANLTPQLPLDLKAGASDSLVVRISPGAEGGSTGLRVGDTVLTVSAHLKYTDNGGTTSFDTTITLLVHVERGIPQAVLSDTALNFGTVSACDSATLPLVISSAGCDTVSEIGYRVQGVGYRVFGNENPLPVGSSDTLYVTFSPSSPSGPLTDSLRITTNAGTETVPLHATAAPGASALSLSASYIDFGSLSSCEARDTTIYIKDSGCAALTLDSAVFSNPSYIADTSFPLIIPAADSVPVRISLISGISPNPGSVTFYSNANTGDSTARIPLVATIIQPLNLTLSLSPAGAAHAGQMVTIYVILTGDTGAAANELKGLRFVLTHNDDLLALQNASGLTWSPGSATTTRTDTFEWLHRSGASAYTDTIGTLTFQVYLTDSSGTPLSLSDISFQGTANLPADCIASVDSYASNFTYLYHCGDITMQHFLRSGVINTGDQNYPNPFGAGTGFTTTIPFQTNATGTAYIRVMDATGRVILKDHERVSYAGKHFFYFTAKDLPAGTYYYQIEFPKGIVIVSRTMIVVR